MPLELTDPHAIAALGGIITMTPGTLTCDVAPDRSHLLVHALHVTDEAALVAGHQGALRGAAEGDLRMTAAVLPWVVAAFLIAFLLAAIRLVRGPSLPDRILALDTLYVNAMALLILSGVLLDTALYFEAALIISALGFIGTVVMAKFIVRGKIIE